MSDYSYDRTVDIIANRCFHLIEEIREANGYDPDEDSDEDLCDEVLRGECKKYVHENSMVEPGGALGLPLCRMIAGASDSIDDAFDCGIADGFRDGCYLALRRDVWVEVSKRIDWNLEDPCE